MIEPQLPPPLSFKGGTKTTTKSSSSSSTERRQSPEMARTTERTKSMKKRGHHHHPPQHATSGSPPHPTNNSGTGGNHHSHSSSSSDSNSNSNSNNNHRNNSTGSSTLLLRGPGTNHKLPPRPPPPPQQPPVWIDPLLEQRSSGEQPQPPSHLQCGSSEDLSFADFSALEDSMDDGYMNSSQYNQHPHPHHNSDTSYHSHHEDHDDSNRAFMNGASPASSSTGGGGGGGGGSNSSNRSTNHHPRHSSFPKQNNTTRKVSAIDVASVGNASDTMVVQDSHHHDASVSFHQHDPHNDHQQMMLVATRDLHEQAKLAFNAAKYHEALPLFDSILSAQVQRFSSTIHPSVGAAMHNVGVCRQRLGQHEIAESLFEEAVHIREQCFGPDHIEVAASLSKLGAAQTSLGKFEEAYEKLRKAVKIAIATLGHNHKTVAQMLCHLACLYFEAGELMSSEATFEDALEIYRDVWSTAMDRASCMTQLTDTLCNVGSIQNRRKRFQAACASFTEALDLQRGIVPPDDARIISTLDNLGYSYSKLKDYNGALQCYRKMYRAQISSAASSSSSSSSSSSHDQDDGAAYPPAAFESFRKQILMYEKLRRYQEAIDETTQTLQHQQSVLPSDHEIIIHTEEILIELQQKLRRTSES